MYNGKCFRCDGQIESCEDPYCEECYKIVQDEYRENLKKQSIPTGRTLFTINVLNEENVKEAFKVANNAIYFDDSSDYLTTLYKICALLNPTLTDDEIGTKYIEEENI